MSRKFIQRSLQLTDDDPRPREGKGQPVILQQVGASSPAPGLSSGPTFPVPWVAGGGGGRWEQVSKPRMQTPYLCLPCAPQQGSPCSSLACGCVARWPLRMLRECGWRPQHTAPGPPGVWAGQSGSVAVLQAGERRRRPQPCLQGTPRLGCEMGRLL